MAMFEALPRGATLANRVAGQMETMIAQGGLVDGSRLPPERDLADQFGVSRTVIREAVAALSARGLLEVQAGSGTRVKRPGVRAIASMVNMALSIGENGAAPLGVSHDQLRETARCLAVEAAGFAAERHTPDDIEALMRAQRLYGESHDIGRLIPDDAEAHFITAVASCAHNGPLAVVLGVVLSLGGYKPGAFIDKHCKAIVEAIRKGDSKSSRRAMRDLFDEPDTAVARPSGKKDRKL